jgi:nitrogen-specific signal transduction histidine kinase
MWSCHRPAQRLALILSADGSIESVSGPVEQAVGYAPGELAGARLTDILADASACGFPHMMQAAVARGVWNGEVAFRDRNGAPLLTHAEVSELIPMGSPGASFLMIAIPDARNACGEGDPVLWEVAACLRKTAHELNNPLAVVLGFTQLILTDPQCSGKMRADMDRIYEEIRRVVQIVERLHAYAVSLQERGAPVGHSRV